MTEKSLFAPVSNGQVTVSADAGGCPPVMSGTERAINRGNRNKVLWYVMRSSYCREMKARELLNKDGIQCYVPTHQERIERDGKIEQKETPIVHNLIFVHSTRTVLDPWKRKHESDAALRYTIDKSTELPMTITEKAMEDFMRVTSESDESLLYLDNPEIILTKGKKVEVILGPFKGIQGYVLRIHKDRRVVVTLGGLISAALATMPQSHFKIVEE